MGAPAAVCLCWALVICTCYPPGTVRNKHGEEYSPTTLHHIVCGILMHSRSVQPCMDFFTEKEFAEFRKTVDGEMKRLQSKGGPQIKKQKY